jgi:4-alpha-glucanotransferase
MSTMREWWELERENIQSFFNETLGHYGAAPFYCEPWIATDIINQHLQAPAMWAVFLLQDLLAIDGNIRSENVRAERINNPADPNHVWNYRMHLNLEDMMAHSEFTHKLKEMVLHSGR